MVAPLRRVVVGGRGAADGAQRTPATVTSPQLDAKGMTFVLVEEFIQGRGDLSKDERAHLLGALGYLTQMDPYILQR